MAFLPSVRSSTDSTPFARTLSSSDECSSSPGLIHEPLPPAALTQTARPGDFTDPRRATNVSDVMALLERLPRSTRDSSVSVIRAVKRALQERGFSLPRMAVRPWVALARPRLFSAELAGLKAVRDSLMEACRDDVMALCDHASFRPLLASCTACADIPTRDFLHTHESALVHYLFHHLRGRPATRQEVSRLMGTDQQPGNQNLARALEPHKQAVYDQVRHLAAQGFATPLTEIDALLSARGRRLTNSQLPQLAELLPELERSRGWVYPRGQAPKSFPGCRPDNPAFVLFRGQPAIGDRPASAGFAFYLHQQHPGGCPSQECEKALARFDPQLDRATRHEYIDTLLLRRLLQPLDMHLVIVNPDMVCARLRESILASCPRRGCSPDDNGAPDEKPESDGPDEPSGRVAAPSPERDGQTIGHGVADARRVFEQLRSLSIDGRLGDCLARDELGRPILDPSALQRMLQQQHPGLRIRLAYEVLKGLTPGGIAATLAQRQWLKPPPTSRQLCACLKALQKELPLIAFAPHNQIVACINRRWPQFFCTTQMLDDLMQRSRSAKASVAKVIDELIASQRIFLFANARATALNPHTLRSHLTFSGNCTTPALVRLLLAERWDRLRFPPTPFIDSMLWGSPRGRQQNARLLMQRLEHTPGGPMPDWSTFMQAFEQEFCPPNEQGVRPLYQGGAPINLYLALELEYALESEARSDGAASAPAVPPARPARPAPPQRQRRRPVDLGEDDPAPKKMATQAPAPGWLRFDRSPRILTRSADARPGGLYELACAIGNALQDFAQVGLPGHRPDHPASLQTALLDFGPDAPGTVPQARRTPDGAAWELLQLDADHWALVGPLLLADLDIAVVQHQAPAGSFAALRREGRALMLLESSGAEARPLAAAEFQALFRRPDGGFAAAVPGAACRGAASRQLSYASFPGYVQACEAIGEAMWCDPPLDSFARWLDDRLDAPPGTPHAQMHRLRREAWMGFSHGQRVAGFLLERHRSRWWPVPGMPPLTHQKAFLGALRAQLSQHRQVGLLSLPGAFPVVAAGIVNGELAARFGRVSRPLAPLVEAAARQAVQWPPCTLYLQSS
ncbi:hypothetical protein GT347_18330 [Xylophilus rhododendri]|uniref:Uncharacterized protein n=1 Tax=Xylophilus rhododendri TaxID=2697032 RepID=A0A857J966_9BURK|nr:hypothetical protein [Xylophilus rhododendri]QHI99763.1 hypothetical protein GT347_18330 [Xylophilus rhododendri]